MKRLKARIGEKGIALFRQTGIAALVIALLVSTAGWLGVTQNVSAVDSDTAAETEEAIEKEYPGLLSSPDSDGTLSKEETTYVVMDADGNVKDISVSEWLRNGTGAESIEDVSTLKDIENTANDRTFTQEGDKLTWDAGGTDIKYRGTTDKKMPVDVNVSYYLDGEKMSASEIAGKAGHVRIKFTYKVNETVESGGYTFTVPYAMASGVLLDDEHFTDVKVDGGKVIDDGSKCICLGIAMPGLQDNLNTDLSSIDIPESVIIDAYTDKFEIDGSYTVALTGLLDGLDLSDTGSIEDKISELESALGQLDSAANKLVSGAAQLSDGADTLDANATKLKNGASDLASGAGQLSSGANDIAAGASDLKKGTKAASEGANALSSGVGQLKDGSAALSDGTGKLKDGSEALSEGTGKLKDGSAALSDGTGQLKEGADNLSAGTGQLKEGADSLSAGTGQLKEGSADLAAGTAELKGGIDQLATGASELGSGFTQIMSGAGSLDDGLAKLSSSGDAGSGIKGAASAYQSGMEKYAAVMDAMINAETDAVTKAKLQSLRDQLPMPDSYTDAVNNYVAGVDNAYTGEQELYAGLQGMQSKLPDLLKGISDLQTGAEGLNNGANQLAAGAKDADDGAKALATGAKTADDGAKALATGAASADAGAKELATGAASADAGAKELATGAATADDGAKALATGAASADAGAKQLASGAKDLDDGAAKLSSGAGSLKSGAGALSEGAGELADGTSEFKAGTSKLASGASELYSGIRMFNNDGIQKLISSLNEADIDGLLSRFKALADASSKAAFIGGKPDKMDGECRIIFKTEAIKAN